MIAKVQNKYIDIPVISIVIDKSVIDPNLLLMFHCPTCTMSLFQYQGEIAYYTPGLVPMEIPIIVQCKGCKRRYAIRSIV